MKRRGGKEILKQRNLGQTEFKTEAYKTCAEKRDKNSFKEADKTGTSLSDMTMRVPICDRITNQAGTICSSMPYRLVWKSGMAQLTSQVCH